MRSLRGFLVAILCALLPGVATAGATETVVARVNKTTQTLTVYFDGWPIHRDWPVSTARPGKCTPNGLFRAQSLSRYHRSSLYNNAPMPFAIFFNGNYAVHGTDQTERLGTPASAGCVRLHPDNAEILFDLTLSVGLKNMWVEIIAPPTE
ncbi:L,D-transpeptidase [Shimia sp. W99]